MQTNLTRRLWNQDAHVAWLAGLTRQLQSAAWTTLFERFRVEPPKVTLLITDLVDFSGLVEAMGDLSARELIQRHNRMLRSCLRAHGGREAAHTGDGIIASFTDPTAAVQCAVEMQRELRLFRERTPGTPLHARIGLHAGRPLPEERRLFGAAVIVAVRVCNVAKSDAIFVSEAVRALVGDRFEYEEQGLFHLKGFTEPHRLHRVV
jgi:adenylate cyclase